MLSLSLFTQAGLKPSDPVDVLYEVSGDSGPTHSLQRVIEAHKQYIESTTKGPIVAAQQGAEKTQVIAEDQQMVLGQISVVHTHLSYFCIVSR